MTLEILQERSISFNFNDEWPRTKTPECQVKSTDRPSQDNGQWLVTGNWQLAGCYVGYLETGLCLGECHSITAEWIGVECQRSPIQPMPYGGEGHSADGSQRRVKKKHHQAVKLMSTTSCRQVCPVVKQKYKKNGKKPKKMNEIFRMMSILNCYKYLTKSYTRIVKPLILHFSI